jgi:lipoyl(octanoyl) transferase
MQKVTFIDLGKIRYADALEIQTKKFNELIEKKMSGQTTVGASVVYFCEHEPVITFGKSAKRENLLASGELLEKNKVEVFDAGRGGDITFHGPGQLVGYPVLDLDHFTSDLKMYMRMLEEVIINTIAFYNLKGYRSDGETGVWVRSKDNSPKKIAAFGVKTSRWITMHGFALNVNVDLKQFDYIVPCGIPGKGVTSIKEEKGGKADIDMEEVKRHIIDNFGKVFESEINEPGRRNK